MDCKHWKASEVSSEVEHNHETVVSSYAMRWSRQLINDWSNTAQKDNKTYRKDKHSESNSYALSQRQVGLAILVSTPGTSKIRSDLHTGQYSSGVPSDHSKGQPPLLPGVRHIDKFLCEAAKKKRGSIKLPKRRISVIECAGIQWVILLFYVKFMSEK